MRKTICITLGVLICALALCTVSRIKIERLTTHARHLRTQAISAMEIGDVQQAEERMVELAGFIKKNTRWLEMVCEHNDLHEIKASIIDAQAAIEFGIEDDFYQAIYRFGEGIDHIFEIEEISLGNLY